MTLPLRLLHTSDWHLGRALYGRPRYAEFAAFLHWLRDTLRQQAVDLLLVAGDLFDNTTPSHRAQALYYRFLREVADSPCRHVVIIAGNHDSPSLLAAPRELLQVLDIHVIAAPGEQLAEELLLLRDPDGAVELMVCAVPYLRDRDLRLSEAGEGLAQKGEKLVAGIREHYRALLALAEEQRREHGEDVPIVAMGHLFASGGQTLEGDGVRDLYVGSLAHLPSQLFPPVIDYLALGHLHVPQMIGGEERRRYSGSPLAMGFGEAGQRKSLVQVDFTREGVKIELLPVPVFQRLERISGDLPTLLGKLKALAACGESIWVEVLYNGTAWVDDLRQQLEGQIAASSLEILRIKNQQLREQTLTQQAALPEALAEMDVEQVFAHCLLAHQVPEAQHAELYASYRELLQELAQQDRQAG